MNTASNRIHDKAPAFSDGGGFKSVGKELHMSPSYAQDPHKAIVDFVTPFLDKIHVSAATVLVATYRQPEKTAGGIILTSQTLEEDQYQGIVGLVLKMGSLSFEDSGTAIFGGFKAKQFDWVSYNPNNSRACEIYGLHCRFISDVHIDAVAEDPGMLW